MVSVRWAVLGVSECEPKPYYLVTDVRPGAAESKRLLIKAIAHFYSQDEANALEQRLLYFIQEETLTVNVRKDSPVHSSNDPF